METIFHSYSTYNPFTLDWICLHEKKKKENPQAAGNQFSYEERIIPSKIISVQRNRSGNAIFVWHASEKNEKRRFLFGLVQRSKTFVELFSCEMFSSVFSCSQLGSNCFVKGLLKTGTFTLCFLHFSVDRLTLLIASRLNTFTVLTKLYGVKRFNRISY